MLPTFRGLISIPQLVFCLFCWTEATAVAEFAPLSITEEPGSAKFWLNEGEATYAYEDSQISRPYFAHLRVGGIPVTRRQPPLEGEDLVDHPTFHPGLWLAFGDLAGADNWRLRASVTQQAFTAEQHEAKKLRFVSRNRYFDQRTPPEAICDEVFQCELSDHSDGFLIEWDSTFTSDREFSFGDQEEMGLGIRIATPFRAQRQAEGAVPRGNGEIRDAEGRRNEKEVWGNSAAWCDYSGLHDGLRVGITIFCHPDNFRPSWFHARDRGLLVANPFGRAAFHKGESSKVVVKPGESLRLRYGVFVYVSPENDPLDLNVAYQQYVEATREK